MVETGYARRVIVPNYVPDPLEVPGNVTELPYMARLRFIRTVTLLFLGSVLVVSGFLFLPIPELGLAVSLPLLAAILVGLELWRILARGKRIEGVISSAMLLAVIPGLALVVRDVQTLGWPVWQMLAGPVCLALYTVLCGRDHSFVGAFLMSLIGSCVAVAAVSDSLGHSARQSTFALLTNAALLSYVVYDLASLLSRRRRGEELAAVTDLYRDVFNIFGYLIRVARHWRKHRIWSMPNSFELIKKGKS
jgi:FtsH-binding integral membrane protein